MPITICIYENIHRASSNTLFRSYYSLFLIPSTVPLIVSGQRCTDHARPRGVGGPASETVPALTSSDDNFVDSDIQPRPACMLL